jgi:hypothetical protein
MFPHPCHPCNPWFLHLTRENSRFHTVSEFRHEEIDKRFGAWRFGIGASRRRTKTPRFVPKRFGELTTCGSRESCISSRNSTRLVLHSGAWLPNRRASSL